MILKLFDATTGKFVDVPAIIGPAGPQGEQGPQGEKGEPGVAGRTPVKGEDYWTNSDKEEIANYVQTLVTVDDELSTTSQNPVQNKVITTKFNQAMSVLQNLTKAVTDVDLSSLESSGIIREKNSDGSTVTYTFEYDNNGNPVKITDSNGNVTTLSW